MSLGYLPVPGRPSIWMIVGQEPTALAVGAGGGCLDIFTLIYLFSPLLKYCLKGLLNPRQPTNRQIKFYFTIKIKEHIYRPVFDAEAR